VGLVYVEDHGDIEGFDIFDLVEDALEFLFRGFSGCMIKVQRRKIFICAWKSFGSDEKFVIVKKSAFLHCFECMRGN